MRIQRQLVIRVKAAVGLEQLIRNRLLFAQVAAGRRHGGGRDGVDIESGSMYFTQRKPILGARRKADWASGSTNM